MLLIIFQDRPNDTSPCLYNQPCVRFCCFDKEFCDEKFIRKNFNSSVLDNLIDAVNYKILLGRPICNLNKAPANDFYKSWSYSLVRTTDALTFRN